MVPGLELRNGHQKENLPGQMNNHGGQCTQKPFSPSEQPWVHPDAIEALATFVEHGKTVAEGRSDVVEEEEDEVEEDCSKVSDFENMYF